MEVTFLISKNVSIALCPITAFVSSRFAMSNIMYTATVHGMPSAVFFIGTARYHLSQKVRMIAFASLPDGTLL